MWPVSVGVQEEEVGVGVACEGRSGDTLLNRCHPLPSSASSPCPQDVFHQHAAIQSESSAAQPLTAYAAQAILTKEKSQRDKAIPC